MHQGLLARGRGRGGAVHRADIDLDLTAAETTAKTTPKRRQSKKPAEVLSYHHASKRPNNPDTGLVSPTTPNTPPLSRANENGRRFLFHVY
ncbi:MAG: hypothetical protein GDA55_06640 [Cellvibrionales bacterium]|nr:hypothetical protein [Cellvibrionales bacterium]